MTLLGARLATRPWYVRVAELVRRRGSSLGHVLLVVSLMVTVALAVAGAGVSHLAIATRMANASRARSAAESLLSLALDRLSRDMAWGAARAPGDTLSYADGLGGGATAHLFMEPAAAASAHVPLSTNNLLGDGAVASSTALSVPPHAAHLVAVGECAGVRQAVEVEVNLPDFPYVLASSGQVLSERGGLFVAGVRSLDALAHGPLGVPDDQWAPGHLASNSTCRESRKAVLLGPDSRISGDIRAQGEVKLDESARVLGSVKRGGRPVGLPRIDVTSFDTLGREGLVELPARLAPENGQPAVTLSGCCRAAAPSTGQALEVVGDLLLDGAVLYVDGDMTVHGGVSGKGAVFVNGRTTIERGARIDAAEAMALLSKGDVTLRGDTRDASAFRGLVYTEGSFSADHITLLGTFVANGGGEGSLTQINDVRLVEVPQHSRVVVDVGPPGGRIVCADKVPINDNRSDDVQISYLGSVADFYSSKTQSYDVPADGLRLAGLLVNGAPFETWWSLNGSRWKRGQGGTPSYRQGFIEAARQVLARQVQVMTAPASKASRLFKVDLNEYIRVSDRLRILVWRDLPI